VISPRSAGAAGERATSARLKARAAELTHGQGRRCWRPPAPELRPTRRHAGGCATCEERSGERRARKPDNLGAEALRNNLPRMNCDEVMIVPTASRHHKRDKGKRDRDPAPFERTLVNPHCCAYRASDLGTWIAHGAGPADRDTVDRNDPSCDASRRTHQPGGWSKEEEQG